MAADMCLNREEVHAALESLYDNVALAGAPLLQCFPQLQAVARVDERAERARAMLLEAIEVMRPARGAPFGSAGSRSYDILSLRYVENLPLPGVGKELSLSRRQVYRDLAGAEAQLTEVLWSWREGSTRPVAAPAADLLSSELTSLAGQPHPVSLVTLIDEALALLAPLAARLGVAVERRAPGDENVLALADGPMLKQVLVLMLSGAVQSEPRSAVTVDVEPVGDACEVTVSFSGATHLRRDMMDNAKTLAASQRMGCTLRLDDSPMRAAVRLRRGQPVSVLVVEDNPGAVELYRRFLSSGAWQVSTVPNPRVAFEVAKRSRPDLIILDIIMPGIDGWSIIKALREHPDTAHTPLVVCSVLEDPQLAEALGASAYLKKPVTQGELLSALNRSLGRHAVTSTE
ncbi:MAG: response regulator [Anaerolineae bacterium]